MRNGHKLKSQRPGRDAHRSSARISCYTQRKSNSSMGKGLVKASRNLLKVQRLHSPSQLQWMDHPRVGQKIPEIVDNQAGLVNATQLMELCCVFSSPGQLLNRTKCHLGWHLTAFLHHTSLRHFIPVFRKFLLLQNLALTEISYLSWKLALNLEQSMCNLWFFFFFFILRGGKALLWVGFPETSGGGEGLDKIPQKLSENESWN